MKKFQWTGDNIYKNSFGKCFIEDKKNVALDFSWECRDEFAYENNFPEKFLCGYIAFGHTSSNENVVKFFRAIERKIGVRSEFFATQRKNIILTKPDKFWAENFLRRSLFTLLLRVSSDYKGDINKCLSNSILDMDVFNHFMNGNFNASEELMAHFGCDTDQEMINDNCGWVSIETGIIECAYNNLSYDDKEKCDFDYSGYDDNKKFTTFYDKKVEQKFIKNKISVLKSWLVK